jgi:hypothetical protein
MTRWWKRVAVTLALCAVPLMACKPFSVHVQLAGFGAGATDGLWLWKKSGESFVRQCRIDISDPYFSGGREVVSYLQSCVDGRTQSIPWIANVERLPSIPTTVRLEIVYQRAGATAKHRASAFNAAGESPLSKSTLML